MEEDNKNNQEQIQNQETQINSHDSDTEANQTQEKNQNSTQQSEQVNENQQEQEEQKENNSNQNGNNIRRIPDEHLDQIYQQQMEMSEILEQMLKDKERRENQNMLQSSKIFKQEEQEQKEEEEIYFKKSQLQEQQEKQNEKENEFIENFQEKEKYFQENQEDLQNKQDQQGIREIQESQQVEEENNRERVEELRRGIEVERERKEEMERRKKELEDQRENLLENQRRQEEEFQDTQTRRNRLIEERNQLLRQQQQIRRLQEQSRLLLELHQQQQQEEGGQNQSQNQNQNQNMLYEQNQEDNQDDVEESQNQNLNQEQSQQQQQGLGMGNLSQLDVEELIQIVQRIDNQVFLSEPHLNKLVELLLLDQKTPFDEINMNQPGEEVEQILKKVLEKKTEFLKMKVEMILNIYDDKMNEGYFGNMHKIVSIIKANNREFHIKRIKNEQDLDEEQEQKNCPCIGCVMKGMQQDKDKENQEENKDGDEESKPDQEINKDGLKENNFENQEINESTNNQGNQKFECKIQKRKREKQKEQENEQSESKFQITDIFKALNTSQFNLNNLNNYDPIDQSISFPINDKHLVVIKNSDRIKYDYTSKLSKIPHSILQNHIFPYLTGFELFKLRGVSKEWAYMIKEVWHKAFKREMFEQLMAADLCKEIDQEFKLVSFRDPFRQKLMILMKAIYDIIDFEQLNIQINSSEITVQQKKIITSALKLLGKLDPIVKQQGNLQTVQNGEEIIAENSQNEEKVEKLDDQNEEIKEQQGDQNDFQIQNQNQQIQNELQQEEEVDCNDLMELVQNKWEIIKQEGFSNLQQFMGEIFESSFHFGSKSELFMIKRRFLDDPDLSISSFGENDSRQLILLILFLKQGFLYGVVKNYIYIIQKYIMIVKGKLDVVSKEWPENKGFLEGAFKILFQGNVKIKNGRMVEVEEEDDDEQIDSSMDMFNILKSLMENKNNSEQSPDIVLKRKSGKTKIFIDQETKLEIINGMFSQVSDSQDRQKTAENLFKYLIFNKFMELEEKIEEANFKRTLEKFQKVDYELIYEYRSNQIQENYKKEKQQLGQEQGIKAKALQIFGGIRKGLQQLVYWHKHEEEEQKKMEETEQNKEKKSIQQSQEQVQQQEQNKENDQEQNQKITQIQQLRQQD
ncbi:F-box domain [Pseudocohnilembus persalinus]|uniref:F-box domain n=1 Tax=Pseudocohnilembus persalinus TaxID=266149 RepID=A0A0V0Q8Q8_PSEPJ|nr:F-box domain [Pseudocohnilembus persalinus]|eukprot:KRW98407.1 F-box domain [Pseudocohnilembus persalinus]